MGSVPPWSCVRVLIPVFLLLTLSRFAPGQVRPAAASFAADATAFRASASPQRL
jgi:hypothetical protein